VEHCHARFGVVFKGQEGGVQGVCGGAVHRVANVGAVEGDDPDVVLALCGHGG
jgi:hypothetical protein